MQSFPAAEGYCLGITSSPYSSELAFESVNGREVRIFASNRKDGVCKKAISKHQRPMKLIDLLLMNSDWHPAEKYSALNTFPSNMLKINSMAYNQDASMLAIAGIDGINDKRGNTKIISLDKPDSVVYHINDSKLVINSISFSPDGKLLATSGNEGKVWLYEVSSSDVHR
ncbi:WD40 repeat domain-containing protein [Endozoicomonas euniceicola]|uniref:Anaphase-promoting complex subunit 4 WD40 domain-containing protein n=1 Tax=Endozoicomonas euniceicola TaxID=1234143 RepID=A0ABY6GQU5_9GAMM|nr:hypothetical protein [Endozoicomonas euniceicola]UYM15127.1 hypothetical protein NX720_20010 [Endozoicomonas euniceicola]